MQHDEKGVLRAPGRALPGGAVQAQDKAKVGLFVTSIYDLNLGEKSFKVDFWLWSIFDKGLALDINSIELPDAKEIERGEPIVIEKGKKLWVQQKIKAEIKKDWDIRKFPFDRQSLEIVLEEMELDSSALVYEADAENTGLDKELAIDGWKIAKTAVAASERVYDTTYGDPDLKGTSSYARIVLTVDLVRSDMILFFKLFTGVYVAFLISILVFFIDPAECDPRFGLSVGGLFAAVGNKYIVDGVLPQSPIFTLVDSVHSLTFVFIMFTIAISIISLALKKKELEKPQMLLDKVSVTVLTASYLVLNLIFIFGAMA